MNSPEEPEPRTEDEEQLLLSHHAYREIERQIVMLELPPGSLLSEVALSKRLRIGRTPIREALRRLEREGLVVIKPRRGIIVTEINLARHLQLLVVRRALEVLIAREAARNATPEQRDRMRELAIGVEEAAARDDGVWFLTAGWEYQGLPVAATHNEYIASASGLLHGLSKRFWFAHYKKYAVLNEAAEVHATRLRAIASGDVEAATTATERLMDYLDAFARSTLDFRPSQPRRAAS